MRWKINGVRRSAVEVDRVNDANNSLRRAIPGRGEAKLAFYAAEAFGREIMILPKNMISRNDAPAQEGKLLLVRFPFRGEGPDPIEKLLA